MFVVSFPYAILHGGLWALVAIIGVAVICCYTGEILVDCLYDVDHVTGNRLRRKRRSYVQIAKHVWGRANGARLVNAAQIIGKRGGWLGRGNHRLLAWRQGSFFLRSHQKSLIVC